MPPRILVVSSESHNRRVLVDILHREHWDTVCASTVNECQEVLARTNVSLVFFDRQLADGSYRDVLRMLRSFNKNVPLVVISRLPDWDEYFEVLQEGAFDLIAARWQPSDVMWVTHRAQHEEEKRAAFIHGDKPSNGRSSQEATRGEDEIRMDRCSVNRELRSKVSSA